jgi:3-phenylpropionate/cinnamic acid dioxygenase small subunit
MAIEKPLSEAMASEIIATCEKLNLDYARLADENRFDEWVQVYAEDAVLTFNGNVHVGRAAIRKTVGAKVSSLHVLTNMRIIPLSASEAEGSSYLTIYGWLPDQEAQEMTPGILSIYNDKFKLTSEGWRISRRDITIFAVPT